MKPLFQKLPLKRDTSFVFQRYETPYFETPLHYHEAFELVLCDGGFGKKVIGNHISEYEEGDLILIGANLPHWFKADDSFYSDLSLKRPASIVIQFDLKSFGNDFFEIEELKKIKQVFERSRFGLEFFGDTREKVKAILKKNLNESPLQKFVKLLEILEILNNSSEYRLLTNIQMEGRSIKDAGRMNKIFEIIFRDFKNDLNIDKMAKEINLTNEAFCRYFKQRTQKTFVDYLNEVRLSHACKLLRETDNQILAICFDSGFNNLSNFNRLFKKNIGISPSLYRKKALKI
jgi:AraC-like DNA-binding protein